jgi:hypothetical protein
MVLSRSLSVKNLRFGLRGGESVSIATHCGTIRKKFNSAFQQKQAAVKSGATKTQKSKKPRMLIPD